ncbi:hypothetical protein MNBD_IGNAVI01-2088 [hydrothermal vent metagenome]|uniref:Uncharacterized protein n=1 Tax=hydrothermal vent metagenome TaxID=652676 RepID=A0A3B1C4T9_9ZZZZ
MDFFKTIPFKIKIAKKEKLGSSRPLKPNLDKPEISKIKHQKSNKSQFQISKFQIPNNHKF